MSLSTVLFLFLALLGVVFVDTLLFVSTEAGVKFFRFNAGLAAILIAIALAFRPAPAGAGIVETVALLALVIAEAAIVMYWATVGRMLAAIRPLFVWAAVGGGLVAVIAQS